jgi:hypothetical protein
MSLRIWMFAALLACVGSAHAQRTLEPLEETYELDVKEISFPGALGGSVTLTPCESCKRVSHPTNGQTVVLVNGKATAYDDFLKVVEQRRSSKALTYVGVDYLIETKLVTRITLIAR